MFLMPVLQACGPSAQIVQESNQRFEHCYRLDIDPQIAPTHRETCWGSWLKSYRTGQRKDRVEYANRRYSALRQGHLERPLLNLSEDMDAGSDAAGPPGHECILTCAQQWKSCAADCAAACSCDSDYQACAERCLGH